MIDEPFFDRRRAKTIASLDPAALGELDTIRFARVAPNVAVVCPFLRFDGEPCEQLITYYFQVGSALEDDLSFALGACHRHLGHALDVLFSADRFGLPDPCDEDAIDASAPRSLARPPVLPADAELAEQLLATGIAIDVDFGTTAIHEGYPAVDGGHVTFAADVAQRARDSGVLELAQDLGLEAISGDVGSVTLATPVPEGAEEWIAQNCALRQLASDIADDAVDLIGYRYRTIADVFPETIASEPRVYTATRTGLLEVRVRIAATPAERAWEADVGGDRHQILPLFVDRLPRPGDELDVTFARYRFVRVAPGPGTAYDADTVLESVKHPSRN
jgi:hypothetical protein